MTPFLNIERSITGKTWLGPGPETDRLAQSISQGTGVPAMLAQVLARQGVLPECVPGYLAPTLRELMPDPGHLKDAELAAERLNRAVRSREKVAIFADYDVDGAASAAILLDWFRKQGHDATAYVPDRIDEGYGPNVPAMEALAETHGLIVCVDCGTVSHEPIAAAVARGAEVIVLDHHLGQEALPQAMAVVNPNRQDETTELSYLCAASVVFMVLVAANRQLKARGEAAPDLMGMLDLVALATVADVAPLVGLNRALVRQGLAVMARRERLGLVALSDVARLGTRPAAYHLGYVLGPRINAGGRIGAADLGLRLLSTGEEGEAQALAERLDALNTERREIEAAVLEQATAQVESRDAVAPLVWASGEGWHPGVVGIVASRLKEKFNRPAVVIGVIDGEGKGSGRSISGVDLGSSMATLAREGILLKGGGHRMAAGLSVAPDQIETAMERLSALLGQQIAGDFGNAVLRIDGLVKSAGTSAELIDQLEAAGPFGASAPSPRFALANARIVHQQPVGASHLKLRLADESGTIDAISFRAAETELGARLAQSDGGVFHFAGRLEINEWGGKRKVQMIVEDAAEPA